MLNQEEFAALVEILTRHVQGRVSLAESLFLNLILNKIRPDNGIQTNNQAEDSSGVSGSV